MQWAAAVGASTERSLAYLGGLAQISGRSLLLLFLSPLKRGRMFERAIHQALTAGVGALPILSLITFFIGVIIALQGAYELQRLGAMQVVASLVAISITRELGPLVTAIVVIGRSGSAFAAEIGTMRVTEELDALQTMALDPLAFLVVPKFLAMALMMVVFFQAATLAMVTFDPYLSSRPLARALEHSPAGTLIVDHHYYKFSSVFFYRNCTALLLNGRFANLEYGAYAPDAPPVFIDDAQFSQMWHQNQRYYIVAFDSALPRLEKLAGDAGVVTVLSSGGKILLTNHPLETAATARAPRIFEEER